MGVGPALQKASRTPVDDPQLQQALRGLGLDS